METMFRTQELKTFAQWWLAEAEAVEVSQRASPIKDQGICYLAYSLLGWELYCLAISLMRKGASIHAHDYPFNDGVRDYNKEKYDGNMRLNTKRIEFVKSLLCLPDEVIVPRGDFTTK